MARTVSSYREELRFHHRRGDPGRRRPAHRVARIPVPYTSQPPGRTNRNLLVSVELQPQVLPPNRAPEVRMFASRLVKGILILGLMLSTGFAQGPAKARGMELPHR